ncbi:MAG TPA: MBL fold metallo-hydrolase [Amnibacterium sp.]|nr:MBL fold metallo-hydrolase [Amnibacterium sp.]
MSTGRGVAEAVPDRFEQLRPGVWSLVLPFSSHYPGATTTYLLEAHGGALCVVDPAWRTEQNRGLLEAGAARAGHRLEDVALVVVTHLHPDHIGMAEELRRLSGASIALHRADQSALETGLPQTHVPAGWFARWGVPPDRRAELVRWWVEERRYPMVHADRVLEDGDRVSVAGGDLVVLHTPGHTSGSICLVHEAEQAVLTGDHVLPDAYPGIGLGGSSGANPIGDYLASLDRLRPYDDFEAWPGHGRRFRPLGERRARIGAHHGRRSAEVAAALDALHAPTVWDVAARLRWSGGWAAMADYRLASALAQTDWHVDLLGRAGELHRPVDTPE